MATPKKDAIPTDIQQVVARVYHKLGKGTRIHGRTEYGKLWKALKDQGLQVGENSKDPKRKMFSNKVGTFFNQVDDLFVPTHSLCTVW